jgi:DNA transformation protein
MGKNTFETVDSILTKLTPIKAITSGTFFGGQGISANAVQFAMIMGDSLFFVVDDTSRDEYIEMGTSCFWYTKKTGRVNVKKYHQVPDKIVNNNKKLIIWAKESILIATKLKTKK